MRRVGKLAAVLILVLSLGLQWELLQTIAWTGMIVLELLAEWIVSECGARNL